MSQIFTYQDYEKAGNKPVFAAMCIREYRLSDFYQTALTAQAYYARKNTAIQKRLSYLERSRKYKVDNLYHKLCSGFFRRLVVHQNGYLLGNGISMQPAQKARLGQNFDNQLLNMGIYALVDGVCWGFWDVQAGLTPFRATEFFAFLDERTSKPVAGVRFYQLAPDKPLYFSIYEADGVTEYRVSQSGAPMEIIPKQAYQTQTATDICGVQAVKALNYGVLPIFALYANDLKQSEIVGLKAWIDAYDFVASDLIDQITLVDGLYSHIKNFGGEDLQQLVAELNELKIAYTDGSDAGAEFNVVESPYSSKNAALAFLENRIIMDFMLPSQLSGRAVTATEINIAREPLDFKVDLFEMQVLDFVQSILRLLDLEKCEPKFKRRTTTNDTEITNAIVAMRPDLSHKTALSLYPLLPDDMIDDNLDVDLRDGQA